jgi:acyl-CoA synthetase (AMP-forming)/AMP-acid ligase II
VALFKVFYFVDNQYQVYLTQRHALCRSQMKLRELGEEETVGGYLRLNAQDFPDRIAAVGLDGDGKEIKRYTYKEYYERAQYVAAALIAKKVNPDDRIVLVFLPGTLDAVIAFFGCLLCGAIPVCVYPPDPRALDRDVPKLGRVLADCNATFVITNAEYSRYAFRPFSGVKWPSVPWLKINDLKKKNSRVHNNDKEQKRSPVGSFAFLQYTVCTLIYLL